ncbi:MAG: radical SAM protein [bacterium]
MTDHRARFYVVEPEQGAHAPRSRRIAAGDGRVLTQRRFGYPARLWVEDQSGPALSVATLLRVAAAAGAALDERGEGADRPLVLELGPAGGEVGQVPGGVLETFRLDGPAVAAHPSYHAVEAQLAELLNADRPDSLPLPTPAFRRGPTNVLFFESLLSTDMEHNAQEISQGVLHMVSSLRGTAATPVRVELKMPTGGREGPLVGVEKLEALLSSTPIHLVCITLLEDYFDAAVKLIQALRELGCAAPVAVGGVMPSLTPEHVAAHLTEVSFVCRGAGEYFVPRLAEIVGETDTTEPWSDEQCFALLALDGLLAIDRAGRRLIAANPARTVVVDDLDAVELDLSHVEARHIEGGIEISTARGCTHHCSFCCILGRGCYQARSVDSIFAVLDGYEARFRELHGDRIPRNAFRLHISDDDFGCDGERAMGFLKRLPESPFRLSSLQVSIADLCRRSGRRLLPEVEPTLLDALRPECFADHGRAIPREQLVADHRPRRWSSYLQLGVESFCDRELVRLAKGYRVAHIRVAVAALAERGIHHDAYFILSGSETTGGELTDSLEELCRLKLLHPVHFHLRYPVVRHLVSYFPSAIHRKKVRRGTVGSLKVRRVAAVAGHPEFDYPFVEHDVPEDPWVRNAAQSDFLTDARRYTDCLVALRRRWLARWKSLSPGPERDAGEGLIRRLDDAPRRLVFELLDAARPSREAPGEVARVSEQHALEAAEAVLGHRDRWTRAYRRHTYQVAPRLVVIPSWQCQLRCRYCYIPKQDGRVMERRTLERAVDLLLGSRRPSLILQFFGAEPLLQYELVQHGIEYGVAQARRRGKDLSFILSSNGWALDEEKLAWLSAHPVKLELSLDGAPETQRRFRVSAEEGGDSYRESIAARADAIARSGLEHEVIMVVHPTTAERVEESFFHIVGLGFRRIQINVGLGMRWQPAQMKAFADGLHGIGRELRERWARGESLTLVNLEHKPLPMRLNGEVTVDHDGTIYGGNAFLHETEHKARFVRGHLDDLTSFDRHWLDVPENDFLLRWSYPEEITANNLEPCRVLSSFAKWLQSASGDSERGTDVE